MPQTWLCSSTSTTSSRRRRISAYVCASKSEGTPNPALEALACGRPVITTRVGITWQLIREGKTGLFVERSADDIAQAIERVKTWNREGTTTHCRAAVEDRGWDRAAADWGRIFDRVLKGGTSWPSQISALRS
jgi:glycosyltransferase involved in cell wall biosynthesis